MEVDTCNLVNNVDLQKLAHLAQQIGLKEFLTLMAHYEASFRNIIKTIDLRSDEYKVVDEAVNEMVNEMVKEVGDEREENDDGIEEEGNVVEKMKSHSLYEVVFRKHTLQKVKLHIVYCILFLKLSFYFYVFIFGKGKSTIYK